MERSEILREFQLSTKRVIAGNVNQKAAVTKSMVGEQIEVNVEIKPFDKYKFVYKRTGNVKLRKRIIP